MRKKGDKWGKEKYDDIGKEVGIPGTSVSNWFNRERRRIESKNDTIVSNKASLEILNAAYNENNNPAKEFYDIIALKAGISAKKVSIWFSAERSKRGDTIIVNNYNGRLSDEIYEKLRCEFDKNPRPGSEKYLKIAENLGISSKRVHSWFKSERAKQFGHRKMCDQST